MSEETTTNTISISWMIRIVFFFVFAALFLLAYVHQTHKLKVDGEQCREMEMANAELDEKIKVVSNEVMRITSRPALERKRQEGFIQMVQVPDGRLVRLRVQTSAAAALPVVHEEDRQP